jgi:WD40 repeat protein
LASGSYDNTIKIWDVSIGALIKQLNQASHIWAMIVLSNGDLVSSNSRYINTWDTINGTLKRSINAHSSLIASFALLPNGDLASASDDKTIKIWNSIDWTLNKALNGHTDAFSSLALMNNGFLVSGSFDKTIRIWNI